jgi:hypothetical protein
MRGEPIAASVKVDCRHSFLPARYPQGDESFAITLNIKPAGKIENLWLLV